MTADGIRHAVAFFTSAFSSYSACRQYREDIERARQIVGPAAPEVDKLRVFFNHPGFIEPMIERVRNGLRANSASPRRSSRHLHGAQHSDINGRRLPLCRSIVGRRSVGLGGLGGWAIGSEWIGLSKPQRFA